MDRIGVIDNRQHIGKVSVNGLLLFIYIIFFCLARIKIFGNSSSLLLLIALIIVCLSKTQTAFYCMLFSLFISDGLMFFSVVSFQALIDLIVTLKLVTTVKFDKKYFSLFGILAILQSISIITFDNSLMNVISFLVRLMMLICIINANDLISDETLADIGCLSVVCGSIIGLVFYKVEYWQRFSAIWNDENFCGMYCLIGIVFALTMLFRNRKRRIVFPILALAILLVTATKTWSRSFIFITCLVMAMALLFFMKQRSINPILKVLIVIFSIIAFYLVINYSFETIIAKRGLFSSDGSDWSNGRLEVMLNTMGVFMNDMKAMFFGCGVENVPNLRLMYGLSAAVTHNTYVDLIIQFGIIGGPLIALFIVVTYFKGIRVLSKMSSVFWVFTIPLIYMATLSITQYTFIYVAMGFFIHKIISTVNNEQGELEL